MSDVSIGQGTDVEGLWQRVQSAYDNLNNQASLKDVKVRLQMDFYLKSRLVFQLFDQLNCVIRLFNRNIKVLFRCLDIV